MDESGPSGPSGQSAKTTDVAGLLVVGLVLGVLAALGGLVLAGANAPEPGCGPGRCDVEIGRILGLGLAYAGGLLVFVTGTGLGVMLGIRAARE